MKCTDKCSFFMNSEIKRIFSGPVTIFQDRRIPVKATPAGYAALIGAYELAIPLPRILNAIGEHHKIVEEGNWRILTPRHAPNASLEGHLTFALKNEGVNLLVLKKLFEVIGPNPIENMVKDRPTSGYARRLWFFYEWLLENKLSLPGADKGSYVTALDPKQHYAAAGQNSRRHRVKDNLPGTRNFCPLVMRTEKLEEYIAMELPARAQEVIADVPRDILARTAAFLLLKDSKSSYAIEGERPPHDRVQRWSRAIGEAGKRPLDLDELLRLQRIVIEDARFIPLGLRGEGGFVGQHDRVTRMPLPDHISARPDDLDSLMEGLIEFDHGAGQQIDPVIAAAALAFGFVYIHPFVDGNGRIHRYLIHHVLTQRDFNPTGVVFPVSSAILEDIDTYRSVLESYTTPLLSFIEWKPTDDYNVHVLNDTADFYRYFDATLHAEFLFQCVAKTIVEDLPNEATFLKNYDQFRARLDSIVDMPDRTTDLLFRFLEQNNGKLSNRALKKEFAALTEDEVQFIEEAYSDCFTDNTDSES